MWPWRKKEPVWEPVFQAEQTDYPSGSVVQTYDDKMWYILKGKKYLIPTQRVYDSWRFPQKPAYAATDAIAHLKRGGTLGFREGTLIKSITDGCLFLVSDLKRRQVVDPDVFDKYGIDRNRAIEVSQDEEQLHELGEVLK